LIKLFVDLTHPNTINTLTSFLSNYLINFPNMLPKQKPLYNHATLDTFFLGPTIGKGTFAKVKFARCLMTKKRFAIKILKKSQSNFSQKLFLEEVAHLGLIQHKSVPACFRYYESVQYIKKNGQSYEVAAIVMEYMPNGDLFSYIQLGGGLHEDVARTCFRTLIETMEDVHNKGVAHRDLKPENLFFDEEFNMKIGDFGLAARFKNEKGLIPLYGEFGTKIFMAPEISVKSAHNGERVDIFSCGVVLFAMVVGVPPFNSANAKEDFLYNLIANKNFDAFWEFFEIRLKMNLSEEVKDLINAMISCIPYERPTIQQIKGHLWYNGPVLNSEGMKEALGGLKEKIDAEYWKERKQQKEAKEKAKAEMMMLLMMQKQQYMKMPLAFTGVQLKK